ncbi:UvrD-helicase domain-containing protein [uncultured Mailhella sp.]|uniref:UvrD-helicase domain-containing protein n=1 Tax=uncultured Mailhella sp. TaxID=1981031 RepID=UPI0025DE57AE|nr:UvrD-helicase domain-containing protein [uncultured Mailhella sp.]
MFRADLHIHSRFSRATSSRLTVPHLAAWASAKGIDVLATGDFTHPAWRQELRDALEQDEESGLFRLKAPLSRDDMAREIPQLAGLEPREPKFMLEAEISSIYKKNGAVRKIHSLVYMPDFESADRLCEKLETIGNLKSDGRPILGLDVKDLLSIVLDIPRAFMIPAHIWTPWFALFGSKSGFNSLDECFEDLTPHIFAAETGLSSDPDMNRCWSHLDRLLMVSSSDAHSGENLAREATLFDGAASYDGIFDALHQKDGDTLYKGTLEFFPEEGKYHLDGHRACGVVLEPAESMKLGDLCPVCGKPLTVGVLHRVLELADRTEPPCPGKDFQSLIPLPEILGEILHCGPKTKKAQEKYADMLSRFGSEMTILMDTPEDDLRHAWPELGEAVARMRAGRVIRHGGYDGEYGTIRLFEERENAPSLLERVPVARRAPLPKRTAGTQKKSLMPGESKTGTELREHPRKSDKAALSLSPDSFSPMQKEALNAGPGPVLVLAGPGAGKTRTLVGRLARLLKSGVKASDIVAVTFTRRAAEEMRARLASALRTADDDPVDLPETDTLHALALKHWPGEAPVVLSEESARKAFASANPGLSAKEASRLYDRMELGRETLSLPDDLTPLAQRYRQWKKERNLADYTDLPETWLHELKSRNYGAAKPWKHILVDEVQDLSPLQKALVEALTPADGSGFFGIGDPDQSIYGFRGADSGIEEALRARWPQLRVLGLTESHRSAAAILEAGHDALAGHGACGELSSVTGSSATLQWMAAPSAEREAAWIADRIAYLIGGTSHQQADLHESLAGCHLESGSCSPGEIAVLCRIKALMAPIRAALERRGIPCSAPETEAFWTDERADALLQAAARIHRREEHTKKEAAFLDASRFPLLAAMAPATQENDDWKEDVLDNVPVEIWEQGPDAVLTRCPDRFDPLFADSSAFKRLRLAWKEHGGWPGLLEFVSFRRELDMVKGQAEYVQLMTLHASKGLEFKAVFIPGAEDGLLPFRGVGTLLHKEDDFTPPPVEEEERLLYVGITRASEAVFLSSAATRTLYGHKLSLPPSPLLPLSHFHAVKLTRHTKTTASQLSLF